LTHKEKQAIELQSAQARASKAEYILKGPRPQTHSATMPAYAFTVACPDPRLREPPRIAKQRLKQEEKRYDYEMHTGHCNCDRSDSGLAL
jgi:hypothetical protein